MSEVTRRKPGEKLRKLFDILMKAPDGVPAREALERLASTMTMTEYEAGVYESSGVRRFEKIVRFATVDAVKAGWMLKHKGIWSITEEGVKAYNAFPDPEAFYRQAAKLYRQWKASSEGRSEPPDSDIPEIDTSDEKSASITYEQADEQAWIEIEQFFAGMNPYEFQSLVADLLSAMGHYISWVAPPGKDGGVDIIAHTDPLGLQGPRIKVQVKRLVDLRVDTDGLKSFMANLGDDDVGLFVTLARFTKDAAAYARSQERRKITLIDLERLVELWIEFSSKLDDRARQRLPLTPIHFLTPSR